MRKQKKPRNPIARELRERGPREQSINNKRNELREREQLKELMDWYSFGVLEEEDNA